MINSDSAAQPQAAAANGLDKYQFKLMYSKQEAAEMVSLSVRTIEYLIANGELKTRRVGTRVLIPYQSLLRFTRKDHQTGGVQ